MTENEMEPEEEVIDLEEQRKKAIKEDIKKIKEEWEQVKEQLYEAKVKALQKECEEIEKGTHEEYLERLKSLEEESERKKWLAKKWKELQLQNIEHMFAAECDQANHEFQEGKKRLKNNMIGELENKQKDLVLEKKQLHLTETIKPSKRILRSRYRDQNPYAFAKTINPPDVKYTLSSDEIWNDLHLIESRMLPNKRRKVIYK
eukprot:CAMPEP_0174253260 /NCGR_PEP_ID=MMETSP0439-20130205/2638_1 /TAXON_ID=0 /ORGANISM="Stereomyxa ramosa, Strain Chinc5" /LENGTH=202 /DNA_ID=CAMNT_0015334195 /DNA_START=156 /DNA_END=764 /DNA_ORIENTATION=-